MIYTSNYRIYIEYISYIYIHTIYSDSNNIISHIYMEV